jgi:hypothetical protein
MFGVWRRRDGDLSRLTFRRSALSVRRLDGFWFWVQGCRKEGRDGDLSRLEPLHRNRDEEIAPEGVISVVATSYQYSAPLAS